MLAGNPRASAGRSLIPDGNPLRHLADRAGWLDDAFDAREKRRVPLDASFVPREARTAALERRASRLKASAFPLKSPLSP